MSRPTILISGGASPSLNQNGSSTMPRLNQNQFSRYPDGMTGKDIDMMEGDDEVDDEPYDYEGDDPSYDDSWADNV